MASTRKNCELVLTSSPHLSLVLVVANSIEIKDVEEVIWVVMPRPDLVIACNGFYDCNKCCTESKMIMFFEAGSLPRTRAARSAMMTLVQTGSSLDIGCIRIKWLFWCFLPDRTIEIFIIDIFVGSHFVFARHRTVFLNVSRIIITVS